jgi:hypothetical protein
MILSVRGQIITQLTYIIDKFATSTHKAYLQLISMLNHSGLVNPMLGAGDMTGDNGSCFINITGVDDLLSVPLPVLDVTVVDGQIAGDIDRAGFATAMMLPPLDAITYSEPCVILSSNPDDTMS